MRKRQPYGAELLPPGSARIEDSASDVDVGYGIAVKQNLASAEEVKKRCDGDGRRDACEKDVVFPFAM
jgi:hypothetical protein